MRANLCFAGLRSIHGDDLIWGGELWKESQKPPPLFPRGEEVVSFLAASWTLGMVTPSLPPSPLLLLSISWVSRRGR